MGWRRDRIANEKIIDFFVPAIRTAGISQSGVVDLRAGIPVVGAAGGGAGREVHTNILLQLQIGSPWALTNTLIVRVFTGDTAVALTLFATSAACLGTEGEDLYLFEIRDLQRYMRVDLVLTGHSCLCNMMGNAERSRREPVYQLGTEKCMTVNKNPASF